MILAQRGDSSGLAPFRKDRYVRTVGRPRTGPSSWLDHDVVRPFPRMATLSLTARGGDTRQRTPVLVAASTGPAPSTPPTSTGGTPPRAIRTNYSKSIPDLLSQGLLTPGTPIVLVKAGAVVANATIDASGKVQMNGVAYDNPSAPATAVLGRAANGYKEWQVGGPTGKRLKDL